MTIQFHSNIRNAMAYNGIQQGGLASASAVSIYSGTQPTAAQITASWATYASTASNFLVHYQGCIWTLPGSAQLVQLSTIPAAVAPTNSGTASWCIIWGSNVTPAAMALTTLPFANFIVAPVSDSVGQGVIRYTSPILTAGVAVVILDGSIATSTF